MLGKRKRKSNDDLFNKSKKILLEPQKTNGNFGFSYIKVKLFSSFSDNYYLGCIREALINQDWSELNMLIDMRKSLDKNTLSVIADVLGELDPKGISEAILRLSVLRSVSNRHLVSLLDGVKLIHPNLKLTEKISIEEITSLSRRNNLKVILYGIFDLNRKAPNELARIDKRKSGLMHSYLIEFSKGALGHVLKLPIQNKYKKGYRRRDIKGSGVYGKVVVARDENKKKYAVKIQKPRDPNFLTHWRSQVSKEHSVLKQLRELPIDKALVFSNEEKSSSGYLGLWPSVETRRKAYIVEDYKDGCTLENYMETSNPDFLAGLKIVVGLAQAIKKYHDIFTAHLDIKPDNIIVNEKNGQFEVSLIDPGLSKCFVSKDGQARSFFDGRHDFHPKEFLKVLKLSIDIYSLGVIARELLNVKDTFIDDMLIQKENSSLKRPEIMECCQYFEQMLLKHNNSSVQGALSSKLGNNIV